MYVAKIFSVSIFLNQSNDTVPGTIVTMHLYGLQQWKCHKVYFFIISQISCYKFPKFQVRSCSCRLFNCHERWKKCFCSSCWYLVCFSEVLTLLNAWSKWPKQLLMGSCDLFFTDADAVQSISSWQNENWACSDSFFMSFRKQTKMTILLQKKSANLSLFATSSK